MYLDALPSRLVSMGTKWLVATTWQLEIELGPLNELTVLFATEPSH